MTSKKQTSDNLERFLIRFLIFLGTLAKSAFVGYKRVNFKSIDTKIVIASILVLSLDLSFWERSQIFEAYWANLLFYLPLIYCSVLIVLGLSVTIKLIRMQNNLNYAGLKNTQGISPKLVKIISIDEFRTKLLVNATGIGPDRFQSKKNDLESSFKQKIEDIKFSKDRKFIEIYLCSRELPTMIPYQEVIDKSTKETSFLLGESLTGGF